METQVLTKTQLFKWILSSSSIFGHADFCLMFLKLTSIILHAAFIFSRGNRAHKAKDLSKAEEFYTKGIDSVPSSERSACCIKPLLLCYSNRAATRISLGRIREALEDCMMATSLDPTFLKVQMRTAK
jgi:tetratricopeptide (TPR) repeat protein